MFDNPVDKFLFPGLEIDTFALPAKVVGGDFWDLIPFQQDHQLAVVIGDVSGHGVDAGRVRQAIVHMARGQSSAEQQEEAGDTPAAEAGYRLNHRRSYPAAVMTEAIRVHDTVAGEDEELPPPPEDRAA